MKIHQNQPFPIGYQAITSLDGQNSDLLMDFGILTSTRDHVFEDSTPLERVFILLHGEVEVDWPDQKQIVSRASCFDDNLWCLNVPAGILVRIIGLVDESELAVIRTENENMFEPTVRSGAAIIKETRGQGSMNDAGTRIVRTAQNATIAPQSRIMFGEDVHYPGKWAGFPSHHHVQPEIYYYKMFPENGFGLLRLGDEGVLVEHNDTVLIRPSLIHPQVAAPGYAMYFLWIIRHLKDNPYIKPTYEPEHLWVEQPGAKYWPDC
ncbi:MAG: 5-deoxy-glucuronate isomerase [Eubacteriales bacterium]|nr:5-deoxy-glucuronate isomerase [Eubacteriales bacterium]